MEAASSCLNDSSTPGTSQGPDTLQKIHAASQHQAPTPPLHLDDTPAVIFGSEGAGASQETLPTSIDDSEHSVGGQLGYDDPAIHFEPPALGHEFHDSDDDGDLPAVQFIMESGTGSRKRARSPSIEFLESPETVGSAKVPPKLARASTKLKVPHVAVVKKPSRTRGTKENKNPNPKTKKRKASDDDDLDEGNASDTAFSDAPIPAATEKDKARKWSAPETTVLVEAILGTDSKYWERFTKNPNRIYRKVS